MILRRLGPFSRSITDLCSIFVYNSSNPPGQSHFPKSKTRSARTVNRGYVYCAVGGLFAVSAFTGEENMAPLELAGRPGNLTDEQKVKLKEMWTMAFKVFGVPLDNASDTETTATTNDLPRTETELSDSKEKKGGKKFTSMFKKKNKEKDSSTSSSSTSTDISKLQISDGEDKYAQTKEFKEILATSSPKDIRDTFWRMVKADHPDALFLRFLRARKWDVDKAIVMLVATMKWRTEPDIDVEELVRKGEKTAIENEEEGFMKQIRLGKSFFYGTDINDRPICVVRVRLHHSSDQDEKDLEKFTVWEMETGRLMLKDKVDTACVLFDMTNFSLSNMDYTPVKFLIKAFEAHYPESLGVCLVHKAPWVFQGIWSIIKGWLDPVVASKIHFTRSIADLEKFIPKSQIIKELEGPHEFEWKYIEPPADENEIMKDTAARDKILEERQGMESRFEEATRKWIAGEDVADERNKIVAELHENYWKLDPYIRARTVYDRMGVIGEKGGFVYPASFVSTNNSKE